MESVNDRRKFVKGLGLFSAVLAGAAVVRTQNTAPQLDSSVVPVPNSNTVGEAIDPAIISLIEEQTPNHLQLTNTYGEIAPPPPPPRDFAFTGTSGSILISNGGGPTWTAPSFLQVNSSGVVNIGGKMKQFVPGTENEVSVKMVPGPDGELYLNVNGQWKRILTT